MLVTPSSIFDYDMEKRSSKLLKQQEVLGATTGELRLGAYLRDDEDGVRVPISVVYRKDLKRSGKAPLYLAGYGSYGFPYPVTFSSNRLVLLDRGFVVALAHIRGGGEMGKPWHDDGRCSGR